ncbi:MAG: hypothetical protein HGA87_02100 [Desulfobulbaceae bacterium]|nr:hypothetical protein [Desulfobulbaceae bacterium]
MAEKMEIVKNNDLERDRRWFPVPYEIFDLGLSKHEIHLLVVIFKLEHMYAGAEGQKMPWHSNEKLVQLTDMSEKSLIEAKKGLIAKKLIQVISGYRGKATEYKISFTDVHRLQSMKNALGWLDRKQLREKKERQIKRLMRTNAKNRPLKVNNDGFYSTVACQPDGSYREQLVTFDSEYNLVTPEGKIVA